MNLNVSLLNSSWTRVELEFNSFAQDLWWRNAISSYLCINCDDIIIFLPVYCRSVIVLSVLYTFYIIKRKSLFQFSLFVLLLNSCLYWFTFLDFVKRRTFIFREMYWSIIKSVNSLTFYRNKSMFQFSLFVLLLNSCIF